MVMRRFQNSGITASASWQPSVGYKWRLIYCWADIVTSATAGTRSVVFAWHDFEYPIDLVQLLDVTGTTVSGNIAGMFSGVQGSTNLKYSDVVIMTREGITITPTLVSGDTYGYRIVVEETLS